MAARCTVEEFPRMQRHRARSLRRCLMVVLTAATVLIGRGGASGAELPDIRSIKADLFTPPMEVGSPGAGRRVRQTTPGWSDSSVHHALYLPTNWTPDKQHPVIVEYAGNGGYTNKFGDISTGRVDGSNLGYGMSAGRDYIWVCMPYVEGAGKQRTNAIKWWGDPDETVRYCIATIASLAAEYGADTNAMILCGFSRGSIACNFIGLRDEAIAPLWKAFVCYSHYDGVRTNWPYAGADRASALQRLRRLSGRPQFICQEVTALASRNYLESTGVEGSFTLVDIPFRNHSDEWILRDVEPRRRLRSWLKENGLPSP